MAQSILDWRFEGELGRGAFGVVLRARRIGDGRIAALKQIPHGDKLALLQLRAEAEALSAIGAPVTPQLIEDGSRAEPPFLATELIEERTLGEMLRRGPLLLESAGLLGERLLEALVQVHARGFLHLDLKPDNAFVALEPARVRLFDFGLSRKIGDAPVANLAERELLANAGTPEYQAPEQTTGAVIDIRADVYAAGAVLFAMLAGRPPFIGSAGEVRQAHQGLRPPRPSRLARESIPQALEEVVLRALAKDPEQRFASAAEMRAMWTAALQAAKSESNALLRGSAPGTTKTGTAPRGTSAVPRSAPPLERKSAGLIYFSAARDPALVQAEIERVGAVLGSASPPRYVALIAHERTDHPVREALAVAQAICGAGLAERAVVDVAQVAVQRRPGSPARFISSAFALDARFVDERAPLGALLSDAASALLPEVRTAQISGFAGLQRPLTSSQTPAELTTPSLERSPLIGREALLAELIGDAQKALAEKLPATSVVIAEPGMGKSRLCNAICESIARSLPKAQLLEMRAPEPVAGGSEALLRMLLDRLVVSEMERPEEPAALLARLRALLSTNPYDVDSESGMLAATIFPAVALALGIYAPDSPELSGLAAAPGALRMLAVRAVGELLRAQARKKPLCLVIDDGHLADDTALDGLEFATLAEAQIPLWICVLARPAFASARPAFGERAATSHTTHLTALEGSSAEELCRALLLPAANVPQEAIARLVQRTQGVPLLLVELVRGLKRDGLLRPAGLQNWVLATDQLDRLPDLPLVEWLAARELDALPRELAAHAQLVALLGAEVFPAEVEGVIAELERTHEGAAPPLDARVGMKRLRSAGMLVSGAPGAVRMRHALVRDAVARAAPLELKHAVHDAAFLFYSDPGTAPEIRRLPLLALHAAESGRKAQAAARYLELGERARSRHSYLEAEKASSRALELFDASDKRHQLDALHARANMRYRIGRGEDALADFASARALAQELNESGLLIELMLEEATALDWKNDFAGSAALVLAAGWIAEQYPTSEVQRAALALGGGRTLFRRGDWARAVIELERAAKLAEACGDAGYETLVISLLLQQVVLPQLSRVEDCERVSEQVIELCRARGDQLHLASAINNRRNLLIARKALADCIADQLAFMRIGRELGMVISEYFGEINLGEILFQAGNEVAALPHIERAVAIEGRHPEVAPRPFARLLQARFHASRGESEDARRELSRIRDSVALAERNGNASGALAPNESVLADMIELSTHDAISPADEAEEWSELVARSAQVSIEQEHLELLELCTRTALRQGRREDAQQALQTALKAARRIPNLFDQRFARLQLLLSSSLDS